MKMRSSEKKIQKSKIALIQLRRAIQLFNVGDYVSSLTLAGAANEILGQLAKIRKGHNTIDHDKWFWDDVAEYFNKDKPSKAKIIQSNNRIKNSLKHHDSSEDKMVEADFKFEAQVHIDSAIRNYWIAFDEPPKDRIIDKYVNLQWM
jgi:hypothetical protein